MTTQEVKRKLTAILSADVKGYSRLMGEDEEWTLRTLNAYKEVMRSLVQQHRGRVISAPGDNVLAEFASVVDAVQCGVEIQQVLRAKNAVVPENRRMEFRIGINLGDVIEEGEQIYGDGVNIAARLEGLAEAGGICISESAYQQIENKLPLKYQYLGEHQVKNITKPVRVYKAQIEAEGGTKEKAKPRRRQRATIGLVVAAIVVIVAIVIWKLYVPSAPQPEMASKEKITIAQPEKPTATPPTPPVPSAEPKPKEKVALPTPEKVAKPAPPPAPKIEVASKEKMALPLPDQPSIAVLPFVNMSEDPKQEFLSDGITESIIAALSKVPDLFVIARNSTLTYKGKAVKAKQVSEELGVRYVLEGSIQRSADRIRITTQLIDALKGDHIWSERYDRDLKDIFALQDEITMKVLTATQVKLAPRFAPTKDLKGKQNLDCYLKFLEGMKYQQLFTVEANNVLRRIAEEAIALCPESPWAYVLTALVHNNDFWLGSSASLRESLEKAIEMLQKSIALDDSSAGLHGLLSQLLTMKREYDKAIAEAERALALGPSSASAYYYHGLALNFAGRSEEALPSIQKAIRLDPFGSRFYFHQLGHACQYTGRFEEAVSAYKKALQRAPDDYTGHLMLAATYSKMGREKEARAEAAEVLRINPKFTLDFYEKMSPLKESEKEKVIIALRKAGLK